MTETDLDRLAAALAPALRRVEQPQQSNRHGDERRDVNVERSGVWMDYKTLVAGVLTMGLGVWWGSTQFNLVQYEIREIRSILLEFPKQIEQSVTLVQNTLTERIQRIEVDRAVKMMDRYSRSDHEIWCLETEKLNRKSGWECAPLDGLTNQRARGSDMNQKSEPFSFYSPQWETKTKPKGHGEK